jgi:hypothetical protein
MMLFRGNRAIPLLAISAVTAILCAFAFLRPANDGKWATMTSRVAELKEEARSRTLPRSVLRGQPLPGNAWDEYNLALDEALTIKDHANGTILLRFLSGDATVDRAMVVQQIADHPGILEHLRLGAQRSDGQYVYHWEHGTQMELPSLLATRLVALQALSHSKISLEGGRTQEAVDVLLDVLVFARDSATNGTLLTGLIGDSVYAMAFDEMRELLLSGKLTRAQLADIEKKLEIVDGDFPDLGPTLSNETLASEVSTMDITGQDPSTWWTLAKNGGWRYGFSSQRMTLAAFEERESYAKRSRNIDQMDFATAKKEAEAIYAEADSSENPLFRLVSLPDLSKIVMKHRDTRARLRLLRAATGFLASGKVPTMADPFGTNLLHAQDADKLKIWSIGTDGKDQKGVGGWKFVPGQQDIVLEMKK